MAYFDHAYKKSMISTAGEAANGTATQDLAAGEWGLVDATTYLSIAPAVPPNSEAGFLLVQGNLNTVDTIGGNPLHGGYAESIKSKVIKTHFINRMWKTCCYDPELVNIVLTIPDDCYPCDSHPQLRIDVKGTDVLRYLNRNAYMIADITGCCEDTEAPLFWSGAEVSAAWTAAINDDATINPFILATDGGGTVTLTVQTDMETIFDNCSFDTRDWYPYEPLQFSASILDDDGDPCTDCCVTSVPAFTDPGCTVIQVQGRPETSGESILRDLIMDGRYRQDGGYNAGNRDSSRFRQIEHGDAIINAVNRPTSPNTYPVGYYAVYYLLHSVPRFNNPTGVFDNDQYLVSIAIECDDVVGIAELDAAWDAIAAAAGVGVGDGAGNMNAPGLPIVPPEEGSCDETGEEEGE